MGLYEDCAVLNPNSNEHKEIRVMTTTEDSLARLGLTPADLGMKKTAEPNVDLFNELKVLNPNACPGCEAEKFTPEFADRSQACKDAQELSELDSIEKCEAWIKREYPSACVIQETSVTEVGKFAFRAFAESPLLALQSVIGQIIKWRNERG